MTPEEDVAQDQGAVARAPQRDVPSGVARGLEDGESRHLVALAQAAGHRMARTGERTLGEPVHRVARLAVGEPPALDRRGVGLSAPERNAATHAHGVTRPLVVGMSVGDDVGRQRAAHELAQDPPPGVAGRGVDEDVAHEVDVHGVGRETAELVDVVGELLHAVDGNGVLLTRLKPNIYLRLCRSPRRPFETHGFVLVSPRPRWQPDSAAHRALWRSSSAQALTRRSRPSVAP